MYQEERNALQLRDSNVYTKCQPVGIPSDNHVVYRLDTQDRLGKGSIVNNTMCNSDESHGANSGSSKPAKAEIDEFFESIWKLYPNKRGKGNITDSKKKQLYAIGYDEMKRAIERYKKELALDEEWRHTQNGSTFFRSGYIDYLDKNYVESKKAVQNGNFDDLGYIENQDDLDGYF